MYGPRGHLLHEPDGRECASVRKAGPARSFSEPQPATRTSTARAERDARNKKADVGCVYGSRGQLLYASPGVECAG
jgi:hypothetical protein